jgi:hypothetical protein
VQVELHATVVPAGAQVTRASAHCESGTTRAELEVTDTLTGKSVKRAIDLTAAGTAGRPRLLALAIIELVSASWSELESSPKVAAAAPPVEAAQALESVRARSRRIGVNLAAMGVVRGVFAGSGPLGGAGLRLALDLPRQVALPLELIYEHGEPGFDLGTVSIDVLSLGAGVAWRREWSWFALRLGGGARGGLVRFEGRPRDPTINGDSFWTGWIAPTLFLNGAFRPSRRVAFELGVEGGWSFSSTVGRVAGSTPVELTGFFIGASLGIAIRMGG